MAIRHVANRENDWLNSGNQSCRHVRRAFQCYCAITQAYNQEYSILLFISNLVVAQHEKCLRNHETFEMMERCILKYFFLPLTLPFLKLPYILEKACCVCQHPFSGLYIVQNFNDNNFLNLFLVAVNSIISYFRYVIQNSVCVVVGAAKRGFLHKDLVESLRTVRKN